MLDKRRNPPMHVAPLKVLDLNTIHKLLGVGSNLNFPSEKEVSNTLVLYRGIGRKINYNNILIHRNGIYASKTQQLSDMVIWGDDSVSGRCMWQLR